MGGGRGGIESSSFKGRPAGIGLSVRIEREGHTVRIRTPKPKVRGGGGKAETKQVFILE